MRDGQIDPVSPLEPENGIARSRFWLRAGKESGVVESVSVGVATTAVIAPAILRIAPAVAAPIRTVAGGGIGALTMGAVARGVRIAAGAIALASFGGGVATGIAAFAIARA